MYANMTGPAHPRAAAEIAVMAMPEDERVWVPQAEGVWFRPLMLNTRQGQWCNLLRVRRSGVLSRHLHPNPVHGYVIKGRWHYLEHDWVAETGSYVFEPPGEIHTLTGARGLPGDDHLLQHPGCMIYLDEDNKQIGFEDVFTKIDMCRTHYDRGRARRRLCRPVRPLTGPAGRQTSSSPAAPPASAPRSARAFLAAGAHVTATGLTQAELDAADLAGRRRSTSSTSATRPASRPSSPRSRPSTSLVNCAGMIARGRELDPAVFADVVDVNLNGTMRVCAAARPLLAAGSGAIVNLASMLSFFGGGLVPGYSASKGGIVAADEVAGHRLRHPTTSG